MGLSNERLALLYNETDNKKSKQKIFLELKNNLEIKTNKIINFWVNRFSKNFEKYEDYQTYRQVADMVLVSTLNMFMGTNEKFIIEKWYIERLKNSLYDLNNDKIDKENYEIYMDFQLENMDNIISDKNYDNIVVDIDNKKLYDILRLYIDKIKFINKNDKTKADYKEIFLDSLGFNKERVQKSYAELARKNNCTRQNICNNCTRYTKKLIKLLKQDNKLESLRQYL